jgi:hypothetical protein
MGTSSSRRLGALACAVVALAAGCGDDGDTASSTTTTVAPDEPVEVCSLLNPETIGSILGVQVTPEPEGDGSSCRYVADGGAPTPEVSVMADEGGGVLEVERIAAASALDAPAADVTIAGNDGWLVTGVDGATLGVGVDDRVVLVELTGADPATATPILTAVAEHAVDALG